MGILTNDKISPYEHWIIHYHYSASSEHVLGELGKKIMVEIKNEPNFEYALMLAHACWQYFGQKMPKEYSEDICKAIDKLGKFAEQECSDYTVHACFDWKIQGGRKFLPYIRFKFFKKVICSVPDAELILTLDCKYIQGYQGSVSDALPVPIFDQFIDKKYLKYKWGNVPKSWPALPTTLILNELGYGYPR